MIFGLTYAYGWDSVRRRPSRRACADLSSSPELALSNVPAMIASSIVRHYFRYLPLEVNRAKSPWRVRPRVAQTSTFTWAELQSQIISGSQNGSSGPSMIGFENKEKLLCSIMREAFTPAHFILLFRKLFCINQYNKRCTRSVCHLQMHTRIPQNIA